MANKQQRMQNANNFRQLQRAGQFGGGRPCQNCGERLYVEGHFVPPSVGEEGFYLCNQQFSEEVKP
jgi:hypothetical protein